VLDEIMKCKNIINLIRAQRLSWLGHIGRMQDTRMVKAIYCWKPMPRRSIGRPKSRWLDDVRKDIQKLKVPNWKTLAQDRGRWRELVGKARTV
jgi:transcription termination factor 2